MLNFAPTEEQEEIRKLAHNLAEQLRLQGRSAEKNGDISSEFMKILAQTGLTTPFPEDDDDFDEDWQDFDDDDDEEKDDAGAFSAMTYVLIAEELGFGDGALAMNIIGSMMGPITVMLAGNEQQQQQYVAPFADDREGYRQRGSFAFAERIGGYSLEDIQATVHKEGDQYILNGTKRDVPNSEQASPVVVLARLEGSTDIDGLCALILPKATGIRISIDVQKLGLIAAPSASYTFENVAIDASCMLGEPGNSRVVKAATLYQILRAGVACGMAHASFEYAKDYAKERIAFGRPIASYQGIAFIVAEMAMKLDAARLLLWCAATSWDNDVALETLVQEAEAAQYQAVKLAKSATLDAIQVMGGAGFIQDHPVEMWARNAAAME
ncbi:MAG: acyl-CoA dehydrogenase family protein [Chloroflexota bacterium]|nr:acyl-CoA dehydrogenase family protein [Chloroflexota bacterium]